MRLTALREAAPFPVDPQLVYDCLDLEKNPIDRLFHQAWQHGLPSIPPHQRSGALPGAIGHTAESVVELLLDPRGYIPLHHFRGPGRHGVDLLMLTPDATAIVAVEVKGTLCPNRWPRLSRRHVGQMTSQWIDKADDPGMAEWDLQSADIYGALVLVNFADMVYRVGFTSDFERLRPIEDEGQLSDLTWLGP